MLVFLLILDWSKYFFQNVYHLCQIFVVYNVGATVGSERLEELRNMRTLKFRCANM